MNGTTYEERYVAIIGKLAKLQQRLLEAGHFDALRIYSDEIHGRGSLKRREIEAGILWKSGHQNSAVDLIAESIMNGEYLLSFIIIAVNYSLIVGRNDVIAYLDQEFVSKYDEVDSVILIRSAAKLVTGQKLDEQETRVSRLLLSPEARLAIGL